MKAELVNYENLLENSNEQNYIIKKYGAKASISDFGILLGGCVSGTEYTRDGENIQNRVAWYWSKTYDGNNIKIVDFFDISNWFGILDQNRRSCGTRPAIKYSDIKNYCSNETINAFGIKEVEFGEYPQTVVTVEQTKILEDAFKEGKINSTGKNYTTDSRNSMDNDSEFEPMVFTEYEYNGVRYIRFVTDSNCRKGEWCGSKQLSDEREIEENTAYWIEVQPIKWLIDEKKDIALSKIVLIAGVPFNTLGNKGKQYEESTLGMFLGNYFSKEMLPLGFEYEIKSPETVEENKIDSVNVSNETNLEAKKEESKSPSAKTRLEEIQTEKQELIDTKTKLKKIQEKEEQYPICNIIAFEKSKEVLEYLCCYPGVEEVNMWVEKHNALTKQNPRLPKDTHQMRCSMQKGLEVFRQTARMQSIRCMKDNEFHGAYRNSFSRCRSRLDEPYRISLTSKERF